MRGLGATVLSVLLIAAMIAPASLAEERDPQAPCEQPSTETTFETLLVNSGDEMVVACLATPSQDPTGVDTLVVIAHGLGWTVQAGWLEHMDRIVQEAPGTAVVATNYRDNFGFPVMQGAEDLIRATQLAKGTLDADHGAEIEETVLLGVSMGGAVSGTAIHLAPSMTNGQGLFDHWVDAEGVTNLFETYAEARAVGVGIPFAAEVAEGIERDAGGTPAEVPQAYIDRSPVFHAQAMSEAGLQSAVLVHAVYDGLVPYDQAREMTSAFVEAGVPVQLNTVLRGQADHTAGTTPTSHVLAPDQDPNEQLLELAGHASEADGDHIVMRLALQATIDLANGDPVVTHDLEEIIHDDGPTPLVS